MTWRRYSTEVAPEEFDAVRAALASMLEVSEEALPSGVSESTLHDGFIALAIDSSSQFLAARWQRTQQCQELFFVQPATKPARLGFAILAADNADIPPQLLRWLDGARDRTATLPTFTTLACLLASQGAAVREFSARERQLEADAAYLKELLAEQQDALRRSQAQLRAARQQVTNGAVEPLAQEPTSGGEGWNLSDLAEWCVAHEEEIVVLPRARNGAKKSRYESPELIGTALEILAGPYREFRRGLLSTEDFEALLLPTGLRLAGSVSPKVAGEQGDAYFVTWAGRRRFLDWHLLKGGGRDERYCFRLYFCWDPESQRAIVGSLPAHLSNSWS